MHALVTGGGGFLGRAVVEHLARAGHRVRSVSRGAHTDLAALGAEHVRADLAEHRSPAGRAALDAAFRDVEVVFHVAALAGMWGRREDFERANVLATDGVLEQCARHGVPKLVFTSSPSVVFDGRAHRDASNDLPYARRYLAHYPRTKAEAERRVLAANGRGGLATCALRPHLIFGPGDPHLFPRLCARARAGRLAQVGDGSNEISATYVDNAAAAHLDAARALSPSAPHAGRAYFICQREPVRLWPWVFSVFDALGVPRPRRRVGARAAFALGAACEATWTLLRLAGEPPMTRFVAQQLSQSHTYSLAPAERDLGYVERIDLERATERLIESLR